jgi:parvulin-like peptidyl-prolyl isomerase
MSVFVNEEKISTEDIRAEVERLQPEFEARFPRMEPGERQRQLTEWATENLVERVLIVQAARLREDLRLPTDELEKAWRDLREKRHLPDDTMLKDQFELGVRIEKMLADVVGTCTIPGEEDSRTFFDQYPHHFVVPEQVHVSHILKEVRTPSEDRNAFDAIRAVEEEVKAGKPFEQAIAEHSDDPNNGGDLGYFVRGQASKAFEDAVFGINIGEVSSIIRTEFGYHLAKLHDRKPPSPVSFEEAKEQIALHLLEEKKEAAVAVFIESLKAKAHIVERQDIILS